MPLSSDTKQQRVDLSALSVGPSSHLGLQAMARVFYCISVDHGVKVMKIYSTGSQLNEKPFKSSFKTYEAGISCRFTDSSLRSIDVGISIRLGKGDTLYLNLEDDQ